MTPNRKKCKNDFRRLARVAMAEAGLETVTELARIVGRHRSTVSRALGPEGARFPLVRRAIAERLGLEIAA